MKLFDVYPLYDVTPVKAKDVFVYDENGTEYLDLYGGHAVISIGHGHPHYIKKLKDQLDNIGFYSNAIQNPLQQKLADAIGHQSCCHDYQLFLCSSGAEAIENALKLASFHTQKKRIIAFRNAFHGRTSAAVAATDNPNINAPLNKQQKVTFLEFNDSEGLENELQKGDVCAVIFEAIQGVGGLDQPSEAFVYDMDRLCKEYNSCLIADEVQSGFGRTGTFFAYQKYAIQPHIVTMAKGMGNGFPIGGILVHPSIEAKYGMLGTTFGGNHLACAASVAVLDVLEKERLQEKSKELEAYFMNQAKDILEVKQIKGRGLMLGLEFNFEVGALRKTLIYDKKIFTGGSSNKNLLRILPPLTVQKKHIDYFFKSLKEALTEYKN
ncbi:MAG: aspartate aminotransferase family protein [Flavobacteriales bacterium]|jgi:acetylornithine/N-succinyldiaminopimelate aminotransferase|nr:aminotransferase class III-fold pyridoxal phosphate-dependent enzyme [Flavobacteriaceae bacterium]MDO7581922.1 aminotransferase class III-fold pyridoxal phosphate-dependent enzyme [Flavobacteriaceae bacterium]MDO7591441.1 aminotransferase class III-fold pyridoxal phosphate-dependent enzyme [Flavobacteriaceae bacterium]MDO7598802.1 aminotransferase class III-fold pyridoxal phosphate-dependent enzyme [Flavobacteriaceae bacterium]MDO7603685.1 aminotransferase class III-fold pyridoxal phosphate-|tara:strand:- start:1305 stop:2444 length:1140 start_codon:yes stop_codon:yes gene_type:complete